MSYSTLGAHRTMVFDEHRNRLYAEALRRVVRPDSVVLDLGAGVGVLGLLAAAAGAARVYCVEPEPVVQMLRPVARANGFDDRIHIFEGRIEEVDLPEKVDVIVSVFTGNLLYMEGLLPSLYYARDKYLKPDGHLIPDRAELRLAAFGVPDIHGRHVGRWSKPMLDLDFSPLRAFAANDIIWPKRSDLSGTMLTDAICVEALELRSATTSACKVEAAATAIETGEADALVGWIRLHLGDAWLDTAPNAPDVHWSPAMLPLDPPLSVTRGEALGIGFSCPVNGDWTWSLSTATSKRRHSTFLGRWAGADRLRKMQASCSGRLNLNGQMQQLALTLMGQGHSNADVASALWNSYPKQFRDPEQASGLVQSLALRFRSTDE